MTGGRSRNFKQLHKDLLRLIGGYKSWLHRSREERIRKNIALIFLAVLLAGCAGIPDRTPPPEATLSPKAALSPEADAYLDEFLDIFLANTINQAELDPELVRFYAYDLAGTAQTPEDTYSTLRKILKKYGEQHSGFLTAEEADRLLNSTVADFPTPQGEMVDGKFGVISLYGFTGSLEQIEIHARQIRQILLDLEAQSPCGWIVDLSEETGGEMWGATAALGPLIGEGEIGAFLKPDGSQERWYYRNGTTGVDDIPYITISDMPDRLQNPAVPVAVLIGRNTISAGEAIAVAFRGRPNTRFFGNPSAGMTTANEVYPLSDGAWLVLTVSTYVDRTGRVYGGQIMPEDTAVIRPGSVDERIKEWLLSQPACAAP